MWGSGSRDTAEGKSPLRCGCPASFQLIPLKDLRKRTVLIGDENEVFSETKIGAAGGAYAGTGGGFDPAGGVVVQVGGAAAAGAAAGDGAVA